MLKDLATLPRAFWMIALIGSLQHVSSFGFTPLVPQIAVDLGLNGSLLGAVYAAANVISAILALPIGAAIDSLGMKRVMVVGGIARAVAGAMIAFYPSRWMLLFALMIAQTSTLLTEVGQQAYIASLGSGRDTERNFGWFTFMNGTGMVIGPLMVGSLRDSYGFGMAFLATGLASLASVPVMMSLVQRETVARPVTTIKRLLAQCGPLLRNRGILASIIIVILYNFNIGAWDIYLPAFMATRHFSGTEIGLVVSTATFVSMLARPLLAGGSDLLGRHRLTVLCLALSAIGLAYVPFGTTLPLLAVAAGAIGVAKGLLPLLTLVVIADYTTADERGLALSLRMMALRLQSVANPLLFGGITAGIGAGAAFGLAGLLMLLSGVFVQASGGMKEGLKRPTAIRA